MATVLHHTVFTSKGPPAARSLLLLHGLLGSGTNWRSFARRLVDEDPTWRAVTVDLRLHGASRTFPPPHTVRAAAQDLVELLPQLPVPVTAVLGHSLGGKVALAFSLHCSLSHLLVLDSDPGSQPDTAASALTRQVLAVLERLPFPFPSQPSFWSALESMGISPGIARWLGMNLERRDDGYHFGPDLRAIRELMVDHLGDDLWSAIDPPPASTQVGFLLGGRSEACGPSVRRRLERLAAEHRNLRVEVLPSAGHWVHVDDPEGTFQFVRRELSL